MVTSSVTICLATVRAQDLGPESDGGRHTLARESRTFRRAPGVVLSEAPYAELPEQGLTIVPLHYAGTLFGRPTDR